jgi:diadenosine tetraphosphatase ApaH/serine/threonine PP2A family protein phosphatase
MEVDPSLKVRATLKSSSGINSEALKEKGGLYVYHLELDYECNEEDPVKRLVVVQLREQADDAPSDQQVETAPKLTFMFRKQCPLPRPARTSSPQTPHLRLSPRQAGLEDSPTRASRRFRRGRGVARHGIVHDMERWPARRLPVDRLTVIVVGRREYRLPLPLARTDGGGR